MDVYGCVYFCISDNFKKMELETLNTENGGEMFIEMSHLFESVLDIIILRKKIRDTQVTVLKKLKQLFLGCTY